MTKLRYCLPLVAVVALSLTVGAVVAGQPATVATPIADGALATPLHTMLVSQGQTGTLASVVEVHRVIVTKFQLAPGGAFPWHQHPGAVLVAVTQGTLTFYDTTCEPQHYPAGSAFFDPGNRTHTARNETSEPVEIVATYMLPAHAAGPTIPLPDPGVCPFQV